MTTASICLYGASHCGFGFIADINGELIGDGSLRSPVLSYAIADAAKALFQSPMSTSTIVTIFAPGGELYAKVELSKIIVGYPLDHIRWEKAPQIKVSIA